MALPQTPRRFFGDAHWREPLQWNRQAEMGGRQLRVFCGSMCDVMEDGADRMALRGRLYRLVEDTPWLDCLFLTKRPENYLLLPGSWLTRPRPNVWLLATAGNQEAANRNVTFLDRVPAVVRGLSCEPLLGPVDVSRWLAIRRVTAPQQWERVTGGTNLLNWLIVGGELPKLGNDIGETGVGKYMLRHRKPPSQTWWTFLNNHLKSLVSVDFFTVPITCRNAASAGQRLRTASR